MGLKRSQIALGNYAHPLYSFDRFLDCASIVWNFGAPVRTFTFMIIPTKGQRNFLKKSRPAV